MRPNIIYSQIKIGETTISSSNLGVDIPSLNVERNINCDDVKGTLTKLKGIKQFGLTISKKIADTTKSTSAHRLRRCSSLQRVNVNYVETDDDDDSISCSDDNDYAPNAPNDSDNSDGYKDWEDDAFVKDKSSRQRKSTTATAKRDDMKEIHLKSSPVFLCRRCKQNFSTLTELKDHVNAPETCVDAGLVCNKCRKVCGTMLEKRQHMRTHIERQKFVCDKCGKEYLHISSLENHRSIQHGEYIKSDESQRFKCRHCTQIFPNRTDLFAHTKEHENDQSFLCDMCGKCFKSRHHLSNHRRTHLDIRPHACKLCPKMFRTNTLLRQHMHVHTGIKEFVCEVCARQFAKRQSLRDHYKKEHGHVPTTAAGKMRVDFAQPLSDNSESHPTKTNLTKHALDPTSYARHPTAHLMSPTPATVSHPHAINGHTL